VYQQGGAQHHQAERAARQKERDTVPPELTEIDRAYQERVEAVTNLKQRLARDEIDHRKGE